MFHNSKGPNEVRIEDIHRAGSHPRDSLYATLVVSQVDGYVSMVAETNGRELDKISFSKRDLNGLIESFKQKKNFVFSPASAGGKKLKFRLYEESLDFGVVFPHGEDLIPEVDDFKQALAKMQGSPTDLYRLYPEIAKVVDNQTAISHKVVWALSFRINGKSSTKNLLRYRGEFPFMQLMNLKNKLGIKLGVEGVTNRAWTEFSEEVSFGPFELVDQHVFNFACSYDLPRTIVKGFSQANHYFVNGMEVSKDKFEFSNKTNSQLGDVIVAIEHRGGVVNDSLDFSEMPTVSVYKQKLDGPYAFPGFVGKTPYSLFISNMLGKVDISQEESVTCPYCETRNCSRHRISKGDLVYINRTTNEDNFLFAFKAEGLIGNAAGVLIPFAPAIIGRKVTNRNSLPDEVVHIEINGVARRNLCLTSIRRGDNVDIVIK